MPTEPSWFHPEAIEEARAAREWYLVRNADAADAFMAELDTAIARIEQAPSQWSPYLSGPAAISSTDSRSSLFSAKPQPGSRS